jgi:hypothetical protein
VIYQLFLAMYCFIGIVRCSFFAYKCRQAATTPKLCPSCHVWHLPKVTLRHWVFAFVFGFAIGVLWPITILYEIHYVRNKGIPS